MVYIELTLRLKVYLVTQSAIVALYLARADAALSAARHCEAVGAFLGPFSILLWGRVRRLKSAAREALEAAHSINVA